MKRNGHGKKVNMRSGGKIRLSVHGSRTLGDERIKILLLEAIDKYNVKRIVTHAEPEGVCKVARVLCKDEAIALTLHFLNFKYRGGAFEHRSKDVLNDSDRAIFIHDGKSKGTINEKKLAEKKNIPFDFYVLEPSEHKQSVGFDIDSEWDWNKDDDFNVDQIDDLLDEIKGV